MYGKGNGKTADGDERLRAEIMSNELSLVIGGGSGLGACLAESWAAQGIQTLVACRSGKVKSVGARSLVGVSVDLERHDWIDVLLGSEAMNSRCIHRLAFTQRHRDHGQDFSSRWKVEVDAISDFCRRLQSESLFAENASVVCVSSVAATQRTSTQDLGYHQINAAIEQTVRCLAVELGRSSVRINGVRPTRFVKESSAAYYDSNSVIKAAYRRAPLGRMARVEEVADVVDFLCGPKSLCITGTIIPVDCGFGLIYGEDLLLDE